jgi:hypothetical protein
MEKNDRRLTEEEQKFTVKLIITLKKLINELPNNNTELIGIALITTTIDLMNEKIPANIKLNEIIRISKQIIESDKKTETAITSIDELMKKTFKKNE